MQTASAGAPALQPQSTLPMTRPRRAPWVRSAIASRPSHAAGVTRAPQQAAVPTDPAAPRRESEPARGWAAAVAAAAAAAAAPEGRRWRPRDHRLALAAGLAPGGRHLTGYAKASPLRRPPACRRATAPASAAAPTGRVQAATGSSNRRCRAAGPAKGGLGSARAARRYSSRTFETWCRWRGPSRSTPTSS